MRFRVYLLRRHGRRLRWRDVLNGPSHVGDLRTYAIDRSGERYRVATLVSLESPIGPPSVPDLYEPMLLGFSTLAFRIRGFERIDSASSHYAVLQEWHCETP